MPPCSIEKEQKNLAASFHLLHFLIHSTNIYNIPGTLLDHCDSTVIKTDVASVPQYNLQSRDSYRQINWLLCYNFKPAEIGEEQRIIRTLNSGCQQRPLKETDLQVMI